MAWSISFGDLLTLLVCFFLVLTQSWVVAPTLSHEDSQVIPSGHAVDSLGTSLASSLATVPVKEPGTPALTLEILRPLRGDDSVRTISQEFDEALVELIKQTKGRRGYMTVRLCSQERGSELAAEVHRLIEQSRQKLTGWEVEASSVCAGEPRNVARDVVAIVEFR
jgi:hypothetical protein